MKKTKESHKLGTAQLKLKEIEKEIAEVSAERDQLKARWLLEKELISELRKMKEGLENLNLESDNYERLGDLGKVAEAQSFSRLCKTRGKREKDMVNKRAYTIIRFIDTVLNFRYICRLYKN